MGYLATPTPKMRPFSIESRSESFYLHGPKDRVNTIADGVVEFAFADISAIRAALDQVERMEQHGNRFEWARRNEEGDWQPVRVVHHSSIELGPDVVPPQLWMTLMAASGPLRMHDQARQIVVELAQVAASISHDDLVDILRLLDQGDAEVAELSELRRILARVLEHNERDYQARVADALG